MRKPYKSQKKKFHIPVQKNKKMVQIDSRTSIEVNVDVPDDEAREKFLARHEDFFLKAPEVGGDRTEAMAGDPELQEQE